MRKINGKLFLALLLGAAVAGAAVFTVHYFQYQRIARALLWQARHAEEQGQVVRVVKYLQRYLEFNPNDHAEKANLARTWAGDAFAGNLKARDQAVRLLDEVLIYNDDPALRRLLIKVALEVGSANDLKRARDHLNILLVWDKKDENDKQVGLLGDLGKEVKEEDPERGELEGYWGQLLEAEGRKPEAIACYRLAVRHAPGNLTSHSHLAYLLRRANESVPTKRAENYQEADRVMNALVKHNELSHMSYLGRWRYRREFDLLAIQETAHKGQVTLKEAADDVAQALKRKPDSVDVLLAAADLERLWGRAALEDTRQPMPQRLEALQKHREKAQDYLRHGLELVKKQGDAPQADMPRFQLLWHKANLLLDDLDRADVNRDGPALSSAASSAVKDEIRTTIAAVRKTRVAAAGDYLQGRLLIHERRWAEAASLFESAQKLLAPQPDLAAQANLYLGQCYERLEEHKQMFEAYQRVANWDPTNVPAQIGMAMARKAQGRDADALAQYKMVVSHDKVPGPVWVDIARLEMQLQAQADKKDWKNAELALAQAEKALGLLANEVVLLRAELALRQEAPEKAEEAVKAALKAKPKDADLYAYLAYLKLNEKDPEGAKRVLDKAVAEVGDVPALRTARARYLALTKGKKGIAAIAALAEGRERFSEEEQARLLTGLADAQMRAGDEVEARKLWMQLAELPKQKNDLRLHLLLFDLAIKAGDKDGVDRALADIKGAEQGNGTFSHYGMALKLLWQVRTGEGGEKDKALHQARAHLDSVLAVRPSWPPVFLARAEIAELQGKPDQAIRELQTALNNGETGTAAVTRLLVLLSQRPGREAEAEALYKQHQRALKANTEVSRMMALVAVRQNNVQGALTRARITVREDTKDPAELVWLARVLAEAKEDDEAEKKLNKAVELGGKSAVPWVAKVQFLASRKERRADALKAIAEAKKKINPDESALALGHCYVAVGQPEVAQKFYQKALEQKPDDAGVVRTVANFYLSNGRLRDAEPLLRTLVSGKFSGQSAPDLAWAKRGLAMVLASGTDYRDFTKALDLVGLTLDAEGRLPRTVALDEDAESRRARARVLASQSQGQFRKQAIQLLESLLRDKALRPDDQYVLALLYSAEGKAKEAQAQLAELAKAPTRTPQYLAQYALNLIAMKRLPGDLAEAEKAIGWLEELEKQREVGPNGFASVELRARLLEARGKGDEAVELVRKHVERAEAKPEEVLLVLASLARQKRYAEAFERCEKVWGEGKVPPEALGAVSVALLRAMKSSDAQVATVEKHLKAAFDANPKNTTLLMHLSDLYNQRGRYDDAEEVYRKVLEREPNNVVALNNLAWLMATRNGDANEALAHINKAVNGMGRRADLLDTRGQVYLALKQPDKAVADLKEATEDAATPARLFHLAQAYHEAKDKQNARRVLSEAKEKGLEVAQLHPIEQEACRKLLETLLR